MKFFISAILVLCWLSQTLHATEIDGVDPNTGYRMDRYRAPVPDHIPGGTTVNTAFVFSQKKANSAILIDVFPPKGMGADPLNGNWLISEAHPTIAGSTWLPEVGRGYIEAEHKDYFERNLQALTHGDKSTALIFFCTADCWQSWNAAKRAISWGYTNVNWYPNGTDGWVEQGHELTTVEPVNFLATVETSKNTFPDKATIYLVNQANEELTIGTIEFTNQTAAGAAYTIDIGGSAFNDHFLSMRPFECIEGPKDWFCYLTYPYPLKQVVTSNDLSDLEYNLLFIVKSPSEFGIDAWNGVYYQLTLQVDGSIKGMLLQGDLNVLQNPPEPYAKPINLNEFIDDEAAKQRFPTLVIRK